MAIIMIGDGSWASSYGYLKPLSNVIIQFFIPDNTSLEGLYSVNIERFLSRGSAMQLVNGITQEMCIRFNKPKIQTLSFETYPDGDKQVKNYKLDSIRGVGTLRQGCDPVAIDNLLKNPTVYSPPEGESIFLSDYVKSVQHFGTKEDPLIIQWWACRDLVIECPTPMTANPMSKNRKPLDKMWVSLKY